jgi:DNA-binding PadR family transcriptional regulator
MGLLLERERPIGGYRLASLLAQRLPRWQVSSSAVANLLKRLLIEGYARPDMASGAGYVATRKGQSALEDWMRRPLCRPPALREDIHARIASSSPHHAALLGTAIDQYERECWSLLHEADVPIEKIPTGGSWRSLTIRLTRAAAAETLRGQIRWSRAAKEALSNWIAADEPAGSEFRDG